MRLFVRRSMRDRRSYEPAPLRGRILMYASSAAREPLALARRSIRLSQKTIQSSPDAPVARNDERQPKCAATNGTSSGAISAPNFDPLLKMPVARARSRAETNRQPF